MEEEKKSNTQIKREYEDAQNRIVREREQDIRLACLEMVVSHPMDKTDQLNPWRRAKRFEHYILRGSNPEKVIYEGF